MNFFFTALSIPGKGTVDLVQANSLTQKDVLQRLQAEKISRLKMSSRFLAKVFVGGLATGAVGGVLTNRWINSEGKQKSSSTFQVQPEPDYIKKNAVSVSSSWLEKEKPKIQNTSFLNNLYHDEDQPKKNNEKVSEKEGSKKGFFGGLFSFDNSSNETDNKAAPNNEKKEENVSVDNEELKTILCPLIP